MTERGWHGGLAERPGGYDVYDRDRTKIGHVDDLFLGEGDGLEYIGVGGLLIPFDLVRVDDGRRVVEVAADGRHIEKGPTFADAAEVTPNFERRVMAHYGLERAPSSPDAGHGDHYAGREGGSGARSGPISSGPETAGTVGPGTSMGATEPGEFHGDDLADEDELRVQRSEEELVAGEVGGR